MNITIFIGGLSGGGAERVVCNIANYLHLKGHDITFLTMSDDVPTYKIKQGILRKSLLEMHERRCFLLDTILRLIRFWKILKSNKTDVYIVMLPVTTIMLLQFKWMTHAKVIASERVAPSTYPLKKQKLLKKLANKADGWVFQTEEECQWYGRNIDSTKVTIIPNAINPDFIKSVYEGHRRPCIVTAGRMTKQKNQALLLKAFSTIANDYNDVSIEIYGEGPEKENLLKFAQKLRLSEKVNFCGYTCSLGEKIKDASLFILSSDYEGMPNALMEAMALGLPCISTDCDGGGARFLIENGKNGLLVPKGDVDALADAMKRMLSDREFAESCSREAHKICERLNPERIYGEWEQFIKDVVTVK